MRRYLVGAGCLAAAGTGLRRFAEGSERRPPSKTSRTDTVDDALQAVEARGFAVLQGYVAPELLEACRQTSAYQGMPSASGARATDEWRLTAVGRFHRHRFAPADEAIFTEIEAVVQPLVSGFFCGTDAIYRSELQLLNAAPSSGTQVWHSDNQRRGLTLVVPLEDFTLENGATQLLPGSHTQPCTSLLSGDGAAEVATAETASSSDGQRGAVIAYDARIYHRGQGNQTARSRPALVLRYDLVDAPPPPGVGLFGALLHATVATTLHAVAEVGAALR